MTIGLKSDTLGGATLLFYCMDIFTVPFYHYSIPNWSDVKQKILKEYNNADMDLIDSKLERNHFLYTDYYKNFGSMPKYIINTLEIITPQIEKFCDDINIVIKGQKIKHGKVSAAWFEKLEKDMNHPVHNHGSIGFSSVCYVEFDPSIHLSTIFLSPFSSFLTGQLMHHQPEVKEGDIVFFPSFLLHYAPTNTTDKSRLIFSFNMR